MVRLEFLRFISYGTEVAVIQGCSATLAALQKVPSNYFLPFKQDAWNYLA